MSSELTIAISGKSGCGNSTVSRLLAEKLGIRLINYTFHDLAREMGISFEEICRKAEEDDRYDRDLDRRQVELAAAGNCVLASRLAIWLLRDADLTVYLQASLEVRSSRIAQREGVSAEQALRETRQRDERDRRRYLRLYGIDIDEYGFAGLVVDAEKNDAEGVVEAILRRLQEKQGRSLP